MTLTQQQLDDRTIDRSPSTKRHHRRYHASPSDPSITIHRNGTPTTHTYSRAHSCPCRCRYIENQMRNIADRAKGTLSVNEAWSELEEVAEDAREHASYIAEQVRRYYVLLAAAKRGTG